MSHTATELLIIYHTEAQQWATYLKSVFTGPISETGICCYDITTVSSRQADFLGFAQYKCKLLILSTGVLDSLSKVRRFFLARVLSPAAHVVVLLCGVDGLTPLLEQVHLDSHECLLISSEQEAHEYLSTVTDIVKKGVSAPAANVNPLTCKPSEQKVEQMQSTGVHRISCTTAVVPSRVPCGASVELFILLKDEAPGTDIEVEFTGETQTLRVKPLHWNERTLCVNAPDFPAGNVRVSVYSNRVPLSKAQLQYYSSMDEVARLLSRVADPAEFMCQALQLSSVDMLDERLSSMLLKGMPTGGFHALQCKKTPEKENHHTDVPSLLHFAAQYGFKNVSSLLLQCPGAERALHTTNRHGETPAEIARSRGHTELHVLLKEKLNMFNYAKNNNDATVDEVMSTAGNPSTVEGEGEEVEDLYAPLGVNDEYDTIVNSTKAAVVIANRPPAPTPRPESVQVKEDRTSYITQVFQNKMATQGNADLCSLPTVQAHGRHKSIGSTYDTFTSNQKHGQELSDVQHRVRASSLNVDEAMQYVSDWQIVQKGMDAAQKERMSQLRAGPISSSKDNECVYGKYPCIPTRKRRFALKHPDSLQCPRFGKIACIFVLWGVRVEQATNTSQPEDSSQISSRELTKDEESSTLQ
ncbi:hypothetical protein JOB18_019348 [Solea senegalensis]|uniref:DBB domain-containing protein n=1 Tax=Solea senegalensis TaxID=28829 RepID=A0AAV6QWI2_SOLSE|nr:hypothetical protein JOB18_019348 [Solea senegalensis]